MSNVSAQLCWGLFNRRARWGLSLVGWAVATLLLASAAASFAITIYPFLATTDRIPAQLLVIEGWVQPYAIQVAVGEFTSGNYRIVVTTGGPVEGLGGYTNDYGTAASVAAGRLRHAGIPNDCVAMVPSRVSDRDRTYFAAVAFARWLAQHEPGVRQINVLTADVHARRTRLLYQRAMGNRIKVGVIAVPSPDYDRRHWWRYSEGVRSVLGETIAYVYAKVFFVPPTEPGQVARQTLGSADGEPAPQ